MNYKYCIILTVTAMLFGCGKKSTPAPKPIPIVSGKYSLVQNSDTLYKNSNVADGVAEILNQNAGGDTSYLNPGTAQLVVTPNVLVDYNPVTAMNDTLDFTSTSMGVEKTPTGSPTFDYDLPNNLFYSGIADGTISIQIFKPSATTVKLVISQRSGDYVASRRAKIFVKD